ncbi:MAG TPA: DUF3109 family protein [Bacteroidia bacterium]|nr:DUF3109 family protein [Bacteroidia bacterium]
MIAIEDTLVSDDIVRKKFVCNLNACKGECCVAGDSGAPLEKSEILILKEIYPKIKSYIPSEGIAAIEQLGLNVVDEDGDDVTPLVDGNKHCAFVYFDEQQVAKCSIEKAYNDGVVEFKKPISCHLYPIRITQYKTYTAVNYHKWEVCNDACILGRELKVPVYQFLKEPLIRRFGNDWYEALDTAAKEMTKN